jgi:hypothetical protein
MNKVEAIEVLESISELYPGRFELTERKVRILLPKLLEMDFERVMAKLSDYAAEKPYPPTIAEIAAYAPENNEHLAEMRKWEQEAAQVPEETKRQFREQLKKLIQEKSK